MKRKMLCFVYALFAVLVLGLVAARPQTVSAYEFKNPDAEKVAYEILYYAEMGCSYDEAYAMIAAAGYYSDEAIKEGFAAANELYGSLYSIESDKKGGKISKMTFEKIPDQEYTGKKIKPDVTIKDGDYVLKKGTDYTVSYKDNTAIGTAKMVVKGKGIYKGSANVYFKIVPQTIKNVKATLNEEGTQYLISYSLAEDYKIDGYAIYWSTSPNGKYTLLESVGAKDGFVMTHSALKRGKHYFFRVTAFVNKLGEVYESPLGTPTYDPETFDQPIVLDPNDGKLSDKAGEVSIISCEKVAGKAFIHFKRLGKNSGNISSIQILRKDTGVDYYTMVAEITDSETDLFIDDTITSKTEGYYIRTVYKKKYGPTRYSSFYAPSENIRWYEGDGCYYRVDMNEIKYSGVPTFNVFTKSNMSREWNCDWVGGEYGHVFEPTNPTSGLKGVNKKYQYVVYPGEGYYENSMATYINVKKSSFEYVWTEYVAPDGEEEAYTTGFVRKGSRID